MNTYPCLFLIIISASRTNISLFKNLFDLILIVK
jgi:hypothetical protein